MVKDLDTMYLSIALLKRTLCLLITLINFFRKPAILDIRSVKGTEKADQD